MRRILLGMGATTVLLEEEEREVVEWPSARGSCEGGVSFGGGVGWVGWFEVEKMGMEGCCCGRWSAVWQGVVEVADEK